MRHQGKINWAVAVAILAVFWTGNSARSEAASTAEGAEAPAAVPLVVERAGAATGRPVLFIPGLGTPGEVWAETASRRGAAHDLHVVTLAGFGGQAPTPENAVIAPSVEALSAYIDASGRDDWSIVGHSMGAQIALQVAAARPDQVEQVMAVDSAPFFARLFNPSATAEQAAAFAGMMRVQMRDAPRDVFLAQSRSGLPIQSLDTARQEQIFDWIAASDQNTFANAMAEVSGTDFRPVLARVEAPVTVLVAWTPQTPLSRDALHALYESQYEGADADIRIVEGARHFIMLDQPDAFDAILSAWLEGE